MFTCLDFLVFFILSYFMALNNFLRIKTTALFLWGFKINNYYNRAIYEITFRTLRLDKLSLQSRTAKLIIKYISFNLGHFQFNRAQLEFVFTREIWTSLK